MSKMETIHNLINQLTSVEAEVAKNMLDNHINHLHNDRWGLDPNKNYLILRHIPGEGAIEYHMTGGDAISWCNKSEGEEDFDVFEAKKILSHNRKKMQTTHHNK